MKQTALSTWLLAGAVVLTLGMALLFVPRGGGQAVSGPSNGEFPADWSAAGTEEEAEAQAKLLGKPMPPLHLAHWHNGELKPEDLKGKVVVLDFWATYCVPCIAAMPKNNQMHAKYKPQGFEFLGICTDTGQERYERIVADKAPKYPIARDPETKTMAAWGVESYPSYAVVDRKGIVRAAGLKHEYIEKVVEKLLAEPAAQQ